jgi:hypothetical protein
MVGDEEHHLLDLQAITLCWWSTELVGGVSSHELEDAHKLFVFMPIGGNFGMGRLPLGSIVPKKFDTFFGHVCVLTRFKTWDW